MAKTAPISLYLSLAEGQQADLEVVARSALAFARTVREVSFVLDPSMDVRLELVSGTEGSLSLNSILSAAKKGGLVDKNVLISVVATSMTWFTLEVASHLVGKALDSEVVTEAVEDAAKAIGFDVPDGDEQRLTEADIEAIATKVAGLIISGTGRQQAREVIKELEKDPAVTGVGVTPIPGHKPKRIIPRGQFPAASGRELETVIQKARRESTDPIRLRLISPVLLPEQRRWKFSGPTGEFGAPIKDQTFLSTVLEGKLSVPMVAGIEMDVRLQVIEEKIDGVWNVAERNVVEVLKVYPPQTQEKLDLSSTFPNPPKRQ